MRWQIVARALDAQAYGNPYAFIALERIGGVVVYDISDPHAPFLCGLREFSQLQHGCEFSRRRRSRAGGVGVHQGRRESNDRPLLVVGYEISGTTRVYQIDKGH